MKWMLLMFALVGMVAGCPAGKSYPGQICDDYEPCHGELDCIAYHCVALCKYEGDCDLGNRCVDGHCVAECAEQDDCAGFGTCGSLGEETRGKACLLTNLPECREDWHCFTGYCIDGTCVQGCDWAPQCGVGMECVLIDDYRAICQPDPDYVPPPSNCAEAPEPDVWCQQQGAGKTCELASRQCISPIVGFRIVDESYYEAETSSCSEIAKTAQPGADIQSIRLFDSAGSAMALQLDQFDVGEADSFVYEPAILGAEVQCDPAARVMWLGCAGAITVAAGAEGAAWDELPAGGTLEVVEADAVCGREDADRFSIYLCEDRFYGLNCGQYLATRNAGEAIWSWRLP